MNENSNTWYFVQTKVLNWLKIKGFYGQLPVKWMLIVSQALMVTNLGYFLSHFLNFACGEIEEFDRKSPRFVIIEVFVLTMYEIQKVFAFNHI